MGAFKDFNPAASGALAEFEAVILIRPNAKDSALDVGDKGALDSAHVGELEEARRVAAGGDDGQVGVYFCAVDEYHAVDASSAA
ncbi:hypothetical protein HG531_012490 [Fusarium graminearum]|nr:hypothetical protein HG531_012490 [Fusarium graminearum]